MTIHKKLYITRLILTACFIVGIFFYLNWYTVSLGFLIVALAVLETIAQRHDSKQ
jgi:hypothetical protein